MKSKTYIVTGSAKAGIGASVTKRILSEGHRVIGTYEQEDKGTASELLKEYGDSNQLQLFVVDHSNQDALAKFVESVNDSISGIVHAQFFFDMENPLTFDHKKWQHSITVNLTTPNYLTHEFRDKLLDGSSIVFITSTEGFIGSFGASAYATTKAAIHNLVKTLANNFGSISTRVNALAAGWIGGVMDTDEVFNMSRKITPLGRLGTPEEIASVVWFLLSEESSFVNGSTITVDGGYTGVDTISKYEFEQFNANSNT